MGGSRGGKLRREVEEGSRGGKSRREVEEGSQGGKARRKGGKKATMKGEKRY
jgi:hypothetical protein